MAISETNAGQTQNSWLKSYHPAVPAEIPLSRFESVADLLIDSCKRNASKPAFQLMGKTMSYGQVEQASAALGAYLQSKGLAIGARVALMMPNVLQYPVAILGVLLFVLLFTSMPKPL